MDSLVYRHERSLGTLTLVLGLLGWLVIIVGTFGLALIYLLLGFIGYLFAQSALIAWIKGSAVRLSPEQFPDLHQRLLDACRRLDIAEPPEAYLLNGGGLLNAFATRFLGRNFVVLLCDVVDALESEPEGINFYIGHELGHIRQKHLTGHLWRIPVLWLPLLGAAYARAKEYTCDLHGRACCATPETASRALVALAAGTRRWETANLAAFAAQAQANTGFWGSFHELIGGYPWLTKRVARVMDPAAAPAGRHPLAYVLAFFVPYGGRAGGGFAGFIVVVAIVGVLAAVAIPAYQDYQKRAAASLAWTEGAPVREALAAHYARTQEIPESLEEVGAPLTLSGGTTLTLDTDAMIVEARTRQGVLLMQPRVGDRARNGIVWYCVAGEGLTEKLLPHGCRAPAE